MNIVWQTPDGGVAVTVLSADALEQIAWARANRGLLAKADLTPEELALRDRVLFIKDHIGLDSHAHEMILKARDPGVRDYVCVGHDQELPTDRSFREAWIWAGGIAVSMEKAKAVHRQNLRRMRAPLLAQLDVEFMRALESGDAAAQQVLASQKQALRNATNYPAIDAATTPGELKAAVPPCLR